MKLTPPAPQHPLRRMRFFVENQGNPKFEKRARHEIERLNVRMILSRRVKKTVEQIVEKANRVIEKGVPKDQRKPFLERIMSKIKKASQRGN